jgi:hypothetical protein
MERQRDVSLSKNFLPMPSVAKSSSYILPWSALISRMPLSSHCKADRNCGLVVQPTNVESSAMGLFAYQTSANFTVTLP